MRITLFARIVRATASSVVMGIAHGTLLDLRHNCHARKMVSRAAGNKRYNPPNRQILLKI